MSNLAPKQASLPVEEPTVVRKSKYVMLFNEMTLEELDDLKRHFDVYVFDRADYKISILELLKDCELFLIDVNDKDSVFYWGDMKPRLETCEYDVKTLYKAKKGTKIDIPKLKALYAVGNVIKYLPETFIKNTTEYIRRMLIDHVPDADKGCGLFGCLKKSD